MTREYSHKQQKHPTLFGSHMPLDTAIHWDWRNPLNIIPALVLLISGITLVALLVS
jgi:hypothetical protein